MGVGAVARKIWWSGVTEVIICIAPIRCWLRPTWGLHHQRWRIITGVCDFRATRISSMELDGLVAVRFLMIAHELKAELCSRIRFVFFDFMVLGYWFDELALSTDRSFCLTRSPLSLRKGSQALEAKGGKL